MPLNLTCYQFAVVALKLSYDDHTVNDLLKHVVGNYSASSSVDKAGLMCKCIFHLCLLLLWTDRTPHIVLSLAKCNIHDYRRSSLKLTHLFAFITRSYKERLKNTIE